MTKFIVTALLVGTLTSAWSQERCWRPDLSRGSSGIGVMENFWGAENISYRFDAATAIWFMHTVIPAGTIDPGTMKKLGKKVGGAGFKVRTLHPGTVAATLSYRLRFADNFQFVRGGKLPGLFGGVGNSGGHIPNGVDGFSFRLMWGTNGSGMVYAYLPTSVQYGTPLLNRKFSFVPGRWYTIKQEVLLNTPAQANGAVKMWVDDSYIGEVGSLLMRTTETLQIEGLFFDVFFGGNDFSWATPNDTYIDFSDFTICDATR